MQPIRKKLLTQENILCYNTVCDKSMIHIGKAAKETEKKEKIGERARLLYVGITRAKEALYIHSNTDIFSNITLPSIVHQNDITLYQKPNELSLQLTHKDVFLNFFKDKKSLIVRLRSGQALTVKEDFLYVRLGNVSNCVAKFSKSCLEKIKHLNKQGYKISSAEIRFIVAWKSLEDTSETAIILPTLHFKKVL